MTSAEQMRAIVDYVRHERQRRGILSVDENRKSELSGIMQGKDGEIESLLERQLITTREGYGAWGELNDPDLLSAVFNLVMQRQQ
jgi:hypothetical protein